jgi:DNA adenine methylase
MQYLGGKAKISKELCQVLQSNLKEKQAFVDLFCGSCNVVSKIKADIRIANDIHKELIALHKAVQDGVQLPYVWTEEQYKHIKICPEEYADWLIAFIGFGCSFSGKYYAGYCRNNKGINYCLQARNSLLKKHKTMQDVEFVSKDYREVKCPEGALIYCDIPYKDTTGYSSGKFNHEDFYKWAVQAKQNGYTVICSEYERNLPENWSIIHSINSKKYIRNKEGIQESTVEILMQP